MSKGRLNDRPCPGGPLADGLERDAAVSLDVGLGLALCRGAQRDQPMPRAAVPGPQGADSLRGPI
eukprot:6572268-Lingulodinium_polyedra.AAC.1